MNDAIARLELILDDEYKIAHFRQATLTAERLSECLSLLRAILQPVRELQGESELLDIALESMATRHADQGGDNEDDDTGARLKGLIQVVETIGGLPR